MIPGAALPYETSRRDASPAEELVVLLDEDRRPVGSMPKSLVHTESTPLHLAFSCYVVDEAGRLLVTRRALSKRTWPGVWTNTCCGHPAPGEKIEDAVRRRLADELGLTCGQPSIVLPDFSYTATAADGLVENEVCPVLLARAQTDPVANPTEVAEWRWVEWSSYVAAATSAPWALSPWSVLQTRELARLEPDLRGLAPGR